MAAAVDFRLYLITDRKIFKGPERLLSAVEEALRRGVKAVQLREKDLGVRELLDLAYRFRELTAQHQARLFLNDRLDVALVVGADGVHLGGESMPAYAAKKASSGRLIIGVSAHSVNEALRAQEEGADFITAGPVYETPSKRRYGMPIGIGVLRQIIKETMVPVFAIGGIRQDRVREVLGSGADGIALISAVLGSKDVGKSTEEFMRTVS